MGFLWPTDPDPDPSGVARFGRVVHWLLTAGAALFVWGLIDDRLNNSGGDWQLFAIFAAIFFVAGRAARYILSGE